MASASTPIGRSTWPIFFAGNKFDIEHTIPRSLSGDDSLANKTICEATYNRQTKQGRIPRECPNWEEIDTMLRPWREKVEQLEKTSTEFQKARSLGGRAKKEYDRLKAVCEVEKNEGAADITAATKEMDTVERQVDPTFLAKYKRARVHHNMPVVPVVNDKCSGCNMSLPMAVIKKLASQETVLECENCGRVLYCQKQ